MLIELSSQFCSQYNSLFSFYIPVFGFSSVPVAFGIKHYFIHSIPSAVSQHISPLDPEATLLSFSTLKFILNGHLHSDFHCCLGGCFSGFFIGGSLHSCVYLLNKTSFTLVSQDRHNNEQSICLHVSFD